jgi:dolichyl-phosphate beta-glucosyltransferase
LRSVVLNLLLIKGIYDSQCGAKLFHRTAILAAFNDGFLTSWIFDVEILVRLQSLYGQPDFGIKIIEVPLISWAEQEGSKLKLKDLVVVPFQLYQIKKHY